jgi:hypothetical protein
MTLEGALGVLAGVEANSISVLTWVASSAVEGMDSAIVIWRFTGQRTLSEHSGRRAQRWVAGSFFLLAPYVLCEAVDRLIHGTRPDATVLAIALTASSVALLPLLGRAKLRLGRRLDSDATSGEGVQNLLCARQELAALIAVIAAGAGITVIDPLAALLIPGIAAKEGVELWGGEECDCHTIPGLDTTSSNRCQTQRLPRVTRLPARVIPPRPRPSDAPHASCSWPAARLRSCRSSDLPRARTTRLRRRCPSTTARRRQQAGRPEHQRRPGRRGRT